jgi:hypothetical protein
LAQALNQHAFFAGNGARFNGQLGIGAHHLQPAVNRIDGIAFGQEPLHEAFDDAPGHAAPGARVVLEVGAVAFFLANAGVQEIFGEQLQVTAVAPKGVLRLLAQVALRDATAGDAVGDLAVFVNEDAERHYVNYTAVAAHSDLAAKNGDTVVARFAVSDHPHVADPDSKLVLS